MTRKSGSFIREVNWRFLSLAERGDYYIHSLIGSPSISRTGRPS
jgi:hypothetical protein